MSGVEALLIGAAIGAFTNLLTNSIGPLLQLTKNALRCQDACDKLQVEVESIEKNMKLIKVQLEELGRYDQSAKLDLQSVVDCVKKLMEALDLAKVEVQKCSSCNKFGKKFSGHKLSKKITAHKVKITELAKDLGVPTVNVFLTNMLRDAVAKNASSMLQQRNWEVNDILQRGDSTRHSQRLEREYSIRSGYGSSNPALYGEDSSQHSSHHSNHSDASQYHRSNTTTDHHATHSQPLGQYHRSHATPAHIHTTHSDPVQFRPSYTPPALQVTHSDPLLFQQSYTTPTLDHMTDADGIQIRIQDPFIPHLFLK